MASPVVVVSSLASKKDSDQEITDKLLAEFGEFSRTDAREIAEQVTHSRGYVLDAAESARAYATSHRVRTRAGLFMRALKEGWKAGAEVSVLVAACASWAASSRL